MRHGRKRCDEHMRNISFVSNENYCDCEIFEKLKPPDREADMIRSELKGMKINITRTN